MCVLPVKPNAFFDDLEELISVHFGQTGFILGPSGFGQDDFWPGRGIRTKGGLLGVGYSQLEL